MNDFFDIDEANEETLLRPIKTAYQRKQRIVKPKSFLICFLIFKSIFCCLLFCCCCFCCCIFVIIPLILIFSNYFILVSKFQYIEINGRTRKYIVYVPKSIEKEISENNPIKYYPLLMCFHGGIGSALQMKNNYGFDDSAEKNKFLVIYPDGQNILNFLNFYLFNFYVHCWNSGTINCKKDNVSDIDFISGLLKNRILSDDDQINKNLWNGFSNIRVDKNKIHITGHSNGGMMVYLLGSTLSKYFASISPVSGSIGGWMDYNDKSSFFLIPEPVENRLNINIFHGFLDQNVKYFGGFPSSGFGVEKRYDLSVFDSVNFWLKNNLCESFNSSVVNKTIIIDNGEINLTKYGKSCDKNVDINLITLKQSNHFWDNMNNHVSSVMEIPYSSFIWDIIKKYQKT